MDKFRLLSSEGQGVMKLETGSKKGLKDYEYRLTTLTSR
jgi:hypothetical protein